MLKTIIFLTIVPLLFNAAFEGVKSLPHSYVYGFVKIEALFSVIYYVAIFFTRSLDVVGMIYLALLFCTLSIGIVRVTMARKSFAVYLKVIGKKISEVGVYGYFSMAIIGIQMLRSSIFQPWEYRDTKTYTAIVNDAATNGIIYGTFEEFGSLNYSISDAGVKMIFTPWYMFEAWICRFCGIRGTLLTERVLPPILILIAYVVLYMIAKNFYADNNKCAIFLLISCCLIENLQVLQDQAGIMLVWPAWGKNIPVILMCPLLYLTYTSMQHMKQQEWRRALIELFVISFAACGTTAASVMVIPIMLGILAMVFCYETKTLRPLVATIIGIVPPIVYFCGYILIQKGLIVFPGEL